MASEARNGHAVPAGPSVEGVEALAPVKKACRSVGFDCWI